MGNFLKAVAKGVKAGIESASGAGAPSCFEIAGKQVVCPHCGGDEFHRENALVDRTLFSNRVTFADEGVSTLTCDNCGRIEWFASLKK
jgi:predicted nucleic-acid-binding Zn-ribbon protein